MVVFSCHFYSLAASFLIFSSLYKCGHSNKVVCLGLFTNESKVESAGETASNSCLNLVSKSTFCFPTQKNEELDALVEWYSKVNRLRKEANLLTKNGSLFLGKWSLSDIISLIFDGSNFRTFSSSLPQVLASATNDFLEYMKWQRVAVITDVTNDFYLNIGEQLYTSLLPGLNAYYFQLFNTESAIDEVLKTIQDLKLRIILLSLPLTSLKNLLCSRLSSNMAWPDYAWVIYGVSKEVLLNNLCTEQIIIFQQRTRDIEYPPRKKVKFNFDEIKGFSIDDAKVLKGCHLFHQSSHEIDIYQLNKELIYLSNYSIVEGLSRFTLSPAPEDLPLQTSRTRYIVFSFMYLPVLVLLTVSLALYVHFRNEPEIKATGVSLNILIYVSCYLLLLYLTALNLNMLPNYHKVNPTFRNFMCMIQLWFNGLSLPTATILSALLVKLTRVFRLFTYYFKKVKKWECHNLTLAMYVLALLSPVVIICIIQSAADQYVSTVTTSMRDGHVVAFLECKSNYDFYWLFGQLAYFLVLCLLLIIMAIKTRKVRFEDFKDTKKVIALTTIFIATATSGIVYLFIFEDIEASPSYSSVLLMLTHCSFILECQLFLFVPKFYTIIRKRLNKH